MTKKTSKRRPAKAAAGPKKDGASRKTVAGKKAARRPKAEGVSPSAPVEEVAAKGRRQRPANKPSGQSGPQVSISLRTRDGVLASFESSKELQRASMQWTYVLRNRRRWNTSESTRAEMAQLGLEQLLRLGVRREEVVRLAESEVIEVSVPFVEEKVGWEARIFPWEYVLSAATRTFRSQKPVTIVRHLDRSGQTGPPPGRKPERLLIVESAPGELRRQFLFDAERELVKSNLCPPLKHELLDDKTREEVRQRVETFAPDVIHLSGFDTNQAASLGVLKGPSIPDGYLMVGKPGGFEAVGIEDLAKLVNAADQKPLLVGCYVYNSAARICPLIVAGGAAAAIGFQDEFDDTLAELFFASFYEKWVRFDWNTLEAFRLACDELRAQPKGMVGTGVVLWSERTLVKPKSEASRKIESTMLSEKSSLITLDDLPGKDARSILKVDIKPCDNLNYSMLHNNCPLFEKFVLRKEKTGRMNAVQVEVVLYVGEKSFAYRGAFDVEEPVTDLNSHIRVPLLYSTEISNTENVYTTLYAEVKWEGQVIRSETHRVTLPPLDEWRDNDSDRVWLPSFVLPRDPAVRRLIGMGQSYVMALLDNSDAGFDGYQGVDEQADPEVRYRRLDMQVQSIWSALISLRLGYINPPPSYYLMAQRLRTPSEVIEGNRGTCIDLALLLASCLEYVDIYPVIFLLKGHAFPGYWRDGKFQKDFMQMAGVFKEQTPPAPKQQGEIASVQKWPWYYGKEAYGEIMQLVEDGRLMPVETVFLTRRGGFNDALDEAYGKLKLNLTLQDEQSLKFDAMIDIAQARSKSITPIPRC